MLETATIEDLMSIKEPHAFVYNPLSSRYPKFEKVTVTVRTLTSSILKVGNAYASRS